MRFVILFACATCAIAATIPGSEQQVQIIQDKRDIPDGASYNNVLELDNGIKIEETGSPGSAGQVNVRGSYSYTAPDGTPIQVTYVADENGYQPQGDSIPTLPEHLREILEKGVQQGQQGQQGQQEQQGQEGFQGQDEGFQVVA